MSILIYRTFLHSGENLITGKETVEISLDVSSTCQKSFS
jgi:hypothetical protein